MNSMHTAHIGSGGRGDGPPKRALEVFASALLFSFALFCPLAAASQAPQASQHAPVSGHSTGQAGTASPAGLASPAGPASGEAHAYQSSGRRDPFLSLVYAAMRAREGRKGSMLIPLERYEISQMTLVAIIRGHGIPSYALVGLPDGKHYSLHRGSVVGINKGRVVSIAPDHIVVRETVTDLTGRKITRETVLKLGE